MKYKVKANHVLWFCLIAIFFVVISYYGYKKEVRKKDLPSTLGYHIECQSDKIDQTVLKLHKDTTLIGAYVQLDDLSFDEDSQRIIDEGNIFIDEGSRLFEIAPKVYARIPVDSLCDFVSLDDVKYISIPENKNEE